MDRQRLVSATLRGLTAALALGLAWLAVQHALARSAQHRGVLELLSQTGLPARQPEAARAAAMDPDPVRGRLSIARALLAEAFDYRPFAALPLREAAEAAAHVNERLELAREIAAGVLALRPSAWQAAMILGGATYGLWSSRGDPRMFSDRVAWEGPLLAAARLAPGEDEPLRFLAVARLEIWPTLTTAERNDALPTLRRAFQDPETFARCAELWLSAAPDRAGAFALVPDDSRAWSLLESLYTGKAQWDDLSAARQQRDQALERELLRRVGEAREHLRGGDRSGARSLAVGVVTEAPVGLRFRDAVEAALALCPPGPLSSQEPGRRWLAWAIEGFARGQAWLSPGAVARLTVAAGELPAAEAALSELAAGNLAQAEVIERRNEAPRNRGVGAVLARQGASACRATPGRRGDCRSCAGAPELARGRSGCRGAAGRGSSDRGCCGGGGGAERAQLPRRSFVARHRLAVEGTGGASRPVRGRRCAGPRREPRRRTPRRGRGAGQPGWGDGCGRPREG